MAVLCIRQSEETPHIDEDTMDREHLLSTYYIPSMSKLPHMYHHI